MKPDLGAPQNQRSGSQGSRWSIMGLLRIRYLAILVVLGLAGGLTYRIMTPAVDPEQRGSGRREGGGANIPVPVATATIHPTDIQLKLNKLLGTVTPLATVSMNAQVSGRLVSVDFKEGQVVKKGDLLAQIDPRPYQFALEQAEGNLARDKATLKNAQLDLARFKTLVAQDSIAVQQLDTQEALVRQLAGTVAADQAQVDTAKLNLNYSRVVAPVDGRTGLRLVDVGNYVQASGTSTTGTIVVITQFKPISVIFTIPEDNLPQVSKRMAKGAILPVTAYDRDQKRELAQGKVQVIDNQIDTTTGTVKLRALFDNNDESLFPNQFVTVDLMIDTLRQVVAAPVAAIQRGAPGTFVYAVNDGTVSIRPVKLGQSDANFVEIKSGLAEGDVVVVDGLDRLKEGSKVIPREEPAAGAKPGQGGADAGQGERRRRRPEGAAPGAGPNAAQGATQSAPAAEAEQKPAKQ